MGKKTIGFALVGVTIGFVGFVRAAKMPPPIEQCASEPVRYVGGV